MKPNAASAKVNESWRASIGNELEAFGKRPHYCAGAEPMVSGSDEIREAVLRARLERAELLIAALQDALFAATGTVVCDTCFRIKRTELCPHCLGLEGKRW